MSALVQKTIDSPLGPLTLVAEDGALVGVYFEGHSAPPACRGRDVASHPVLDAASRQLTEYFAGTRREFSIPLAAPGTPFQRAVWSQLETIPFGERRSYAWLAQRVGNPRASRAVGGANRRNPLSIVVPCHRVIGAGGGLTGYAGGLDVKRWLLDHEAAIAGVEGVGMAQPIRPEGS